MVIKLERLNITLLLTLFMFFACSLLSVFNPMDSYAATKGLTLSPLRSELEIAPGTSIEGILNITNSTSEKMTVQLNAEEFNVANQHYDYVFTPDSDVTKWVWFDESAFVLASSQSKTVNYRIGVPLGSEPGGRYISLFASTDAGALDTGLNSRQRVASLVYINVIGDVTRSGSMMSLSSPWLVGGDSIWSATLQNTGTTHFRSQYSIQIKDLIWNNDTVVMSGDALILPSSVRLVTDNLPSPKMPGLYKIIYKIGLGDTPAVTETRYVLYIPIWLIILVFAAGTVLMLTRIRKKFATKN